MTEQQETAGIDIDGAVKIGNLVHFLGVLVVVAGAIAGVVALVNGDPLGFVVAVAVGVVSGFTLMALGAIVRLLTHIARR